MENEIGGYERTNFTEPKLTIDDTQQTRALVIIILHSLFAVILTLENGVLGIIILLKRKLRSTPKYFIVLNLSVIGFIEGIFVNPVLAVVWHRGKFPCFLGAPIDMIVTVFPFVDVMLLISMCIQWIASITIPSYNTKSGFRLTLFLTVLSWLSSIFITLAFLIPGATIFYYDFGCIYYLHATYNFLLSTAITIPLLLILVVTTALLFIVRSRQKRGLYNTESNRKKFPSDVVLCAFILLFCIGSLSCAYILDSELAIIITSRFEMSRHVLIPLIWLIGSKTIRKSLTCKEGETQVEMHDLTSKPIQ